MKEVLSLIKGVKIGRHFSLKRGQNSTPINIIRQILKIRKLETQERLEQEELLDLYLTALGMNGQASPEDISKAA